MKISLRIFKTNQICNFMRAIVDEARFVKRQKHWANDHGFSGERKARDLCSRSGPNTANNKLNIQAYIVIG